MTKLLYSHTFILPTLAHSFGLDLSDAQLAAFDRYAKFLVEWNTRVNLTAITDPAEIAVKHFADSLSVALAFSSEKRAASQKLIDVGAGAGFPGVPLAIAFPHWRVTLLEATGKKVAFLDKLKSQLPLTHYQAFHARAEDLAHDAQHREQYDVAVARALAELPTLLEYTLPFVRVGGIVVAQKAKDVDAEIRTSEKALRTLGGQLREVIPVQLPNLEARHLVVLGKSAHTPEAYPRRAGVPGKKPQSAQR